MMTDNKIYEYVKSNLQRGYSRESIKQTVAASGYDSAIVDQVAAQMKSDFGSRTKMAPLVADTYSFVDRIKSHLIVVEVVVLVVVILLAFYVFFL